MSQAPFGDMSAVLAVRRSISDSLQPERKPQVAITACMRKLLTILNAIQKLDFLEPEVGVTY
ncbi:MAG: hypothetical protein P4L43_04075 [Syntrophobacteraceae bacterium]|nr:hypothetical protein [Syntrophobacteraceae bacterium]